MKLKVKVMKGRDVLAEIEGREVPLDIGAAHRMITACERDLEKLTGHRVHIDLVTDTADTRRSANRKVRDKGEKELRTTDSPTEGEKPDDKKGKKGGE